LTLDLVRGVRTDELVGYAHQALLVLLLGTASYYVGYYSSLGVGWQRIFPKLQGMVWDRSRILIVTFVTAAIFVITYGIFQSRLGISILDFTQLGAGKRVWRDDPTLSWMIRGIEIGFLPVMLYVSWSFATRRGLRSLLIPGAIILALAALSSRVG